MRLLYKRIEELEEENRQLKTKVFSLDILKENDEEFQQFTNFPNYGVFKALCQYLYEICNGDLNYWRGSSTDIGVKHRLNKPGPGRRMTFEEFFMVLVKLKTGDFNLETTRKFGMSESHMSKIFSTWINFLHLELRVLFEMKTNWNDIKSIPKRFQQYPDLISIIDCTEARVERSGLLQARKETYSNYKSMDTVKFMVGLSPNMTINFVSKAYGGRASDKHITLSSDHFLNALPLNSSVMADKGFNVSRELRDRGVKLILPNYKGSDRSQMSAEEAANCEAISSTRIHVERIIQRIRTFHILDATLKISKQDVTEQMFTVCAYLSNFQMPIVNIHSVLASPVSESESIFDFI
ncbi:uncharacterized protein KZ484_000390 [Pholidichthys leucotaenia]